MKSVCVKHEQAFETECPWCETERAEAAKPDHGTVVEVRGLDVSGQRATFTWMAMSDGLFCRYCMLCFLPDEQNEGGCHLECLPRLEQALLR